MNFCKGLFFVVGIVLMLGCENSKMKEAPLFTAIHAAQTGIDFENKLVPTPELNMLKYMYYYNGAGVAAADFNNDGKIDLFFAGNQRPNSLYLNEGELHFKDVSAVAGIPVDGGWNTGVSVVDINQDGLLDIYVCRVSQFRSLKGSNLLLVCKEIVGGVPRYEEQAGAYGLNFSGFSTQACFFDMDLDGDLDMFLLNHSVNHDGNFAPRAIFENTYDSLTGDQLFLNEGNHFANITKHSGINSSKIGYGLGIAVSDLDLDGWPDLYIGNDFHENDYMYINQHDGTFKEALNQHVMHTSQFSMGVDIADINNDAFPDVISMDMLPDDPGILKSSLGEDDYETSLNKLRIGYNHQYSRNNLQLNQRNGMFAEVAFYSGVFASDWSWACLWTDFNNDGYKDLFVANGIPKRLNDIDYVTYLVNDAVQQKIQTNTLDDNEMAAIYKFPEIKLPNRFFKSNGSNVTFTDVSDQVEGNIPTFSNGAVYADLDNDGDQDIVVNNINDRALLYRNNQQAPKQSHKSISLHGSTFNRTAIGTRLYLFAGDSILLFEKYGVRGFLSSMEIPLMATTGNMKIDSALVVWPDNTYMPFAWDSMETAQLQWKAGLPSFNFSTIKNFGKATAYNFTDITARVSLNWLHEENDFNEYNREPLLAKMLGSEGPALAIGDLNGDGLDDVFVGASKWKRSQVFFQNKSARFDMSPQPNLWTDSTFEDVDAAIVDVNNDGFKDLVVASGGNEYYGKEPWMQPRIYLSDGAGRLSRLADPFPNVYTTQSCIKACDFNADGWVDFFIGSRATPFKYGTPTPSYLMQNDGTGHFKDVSQLLGDQLQPAGFVTNAAWADINKDRFQDLIITREWGKIEAYINQGGSSFMQRNLIPDNGWWNVVLATDVDMDGDVDLIAGNQGENCRIKVSTSSPMKMYYNDFDDNGTREQLITYFHKGKELPLATKMELEKQLPYLKKKYLYAADFAKASLDELFEKSKLKNSLVYTADNFSSLVLLNDGKGNFTAKALPWQAQLSCIRDAAVIQFDAGRKPDVFIGGNFYDQAMQLNRSDASFGTILINQGHANFFAENLGAVVIKNQIRRIRSINIEGKQAFVVARNNDSLLVLQPFRKQDNRQ